VNHGVLLEFWINRLADIDDLADRVAALRKDFDALVPTSNSLERRLLANLSWVYAVARLLINKKLMPLSRVVIDDHFRAVATSALIALNRDDEVLRVATDAVLRHLGRRNAYPLARSAVPLDAVEASDGFRRKDTGTMYLHVRMSHVSQLVSRALQEGVYRNLERMGVLVANGRERTWPVLQKGLGRARYLRVDLTRLRSILREI
jgi:hypothetical protein